MYLIDEGELIAKSAAPETEFLQAAKNALPKLPACSMANDSEVVFSTDSKNDLLEWLKNILSDDRLEHIQDLERNYDFEYWLFIDRNKVQSLFFYVRLFSPDPSSTEGSIFYGWQVTRVTERRFIVQRIGE